MEIIILINLASTILIKVLLIFFMKTITQLLLKKTLFLLNTINSFFDMIEV